MTFWDIVGKKQPAPQEGDLLAPETTGEGFDSIIKTGITGLVMELVTPWFEHCMTAYSEETFHEKLANGFDFIQDWETNHPHRLEMIVKRARRIRHFIKFDEKEMTERVVRQLAKKGWSVHPAEKELLVRTFLQLKQRIYAD